MRDDERHQVIYETCPECHGRALKRYELDIEKHASLVSLKTIYCDKGF